MSDRIGKRNGLLGLILSLALALPVQGAPQSKNGRIVEQIIARVNNDIVTSSEYERTKSSLRDEVTRDCATCTAAQIGERLAPLETNLLRDMIDNLLMVQRAQDMGINVDTTLIRRLDEIRQQNNIPSMEDLEKAIRSEGLSYEDFKTNIRNALYREEVIRREVGSRAMPDSTEIQKYYDEHQQDFVRPESVYVREIFVSTQGKTEEEKAALRAKAEELHTRVVAGEDFGELAKRFSDAGTASRSGDLGSFRRGMMDPLLEEAVFKLNRNEFTDVIEIATGFEILQVMERYEAGQQPRDKVEIEITNVLYEQKMRPALRAYLDKLRENSYIEVKPPYVDTSEVPSRPLEELPAVSEGR